MKHCLIFIFILSLETACAQHFTVGVNANLLFWKGNFPENKGQVDLPDWQYQEENVLLINYQATFGFYYPVLKLADGRFTVGPCLNVAMGYLVNNEIAINGALTIDFPEYAMIRYGAGSAKDEDEGFGAGIGIGYTREWMPIPLGAPAACAEFFYNNVSLRIGTDLANRHLYAYYSSEGLIPELTYHELIILFSFRM